MEFKCPTKNGTRVGSKSARFYEALLDKWLLEKKQGTKEKENPHTYKVSINDWCENISFGRC